MSRAADWVRAGTRRGLDGGAHAHPENDQPYPTSEIHHRCFSFGLWQDQPGDADPDYPGMESRDGRRRYRVDEVRRGWPAVCDQPGVRIFRSSARNEHEVEQERHAYGDSEFHLYELRDHTGRPHL